jgi:hypothetical protein
MFMRNGQLATLIERKLDSGDYDEGCVATYIQVDEYWGFKWYHSTYEGNKLFRRHKKAAKLGVGPEIGPRRDLVLKDGTEIFGFFIETVELAENHVIKSLGYKSYRTIPAKELRNIDEHLELLCDRREVQQLANKCRSHKMLWPDLHSGNFGYRQDGTVLRIDFDDY